MAWPFSRLLDFIDNSTPYVSADFLNRIQDAIIGLGRGPGAPTFGDGSDGVVTADGVASVPGCTLAGSIYTATRDLFFQDLTVLGGVTIDGAGFRVYVSRRLTMSATGALISADGAAAAGTAAGAAPAGVLNGGGGGAGAPGAAGAGTAGASLTRALGGAGGGGASGFSGGAGGANGSATAPTAAQGSFRVPPSSISGLLAGSAGAGIIAGGAGGGGGGGGGTIGAAGGGGGGSGGNVLLLCAREIDFGSRVDLALAARGGRGADAPAVGLLGGGGGGGGGGGAVLLTYHALIGASMPVVSVVGGVGGAGNGGAGAGSAGSAGLSWSQAV